MQIETSSTIPFSRAYTFKEFQEQVQVFDFVTTLMSLQILSTLLGNQTDLGINIELDFHCSEKVKYRIILPKDFISFFAKIAVLECKKSELKYNDFDVVNLSYQYGNMITDLNYVRPKSNDAWLWALRACNQQWFYHKHPVSIIGRYVYLYKKLIEDRPDMQEKTKSALNLDIFDALQIGTCIFANYGHKVGTQYGTSFEIATYTNTTINELKSLLTEDNIKKYLSLFSANQEEFKNIYEKYKIDNPLLKKYEFNPLKRFPIIRTTSQLSHEKYIIPSLTDFLYACFEGVYYILIEKLKENDKEQLFQTLGKVFEGYIGDLLKYYKVDTYRNLEILPEQTYQNGKNQVKSADWLVISDKYIYQIECKKRKLDNYARAGIQSDETTGIYSFLESVAKEVDKFEEKEKHIKAGMVTALEYNKQAFINIIVYLDEMFSINEYAKDYIKSKMKSSIDNFYILGCQDFEVLCQHAQDHNVDIKASLDSLIENTINIYKIDFLHEIYQQFFKGMRHENGEN